MSNKLCKGLRGTQRTRIAQSALTNLQSRVRIPSTPSMLLCHSYNHNICRCIEKEVENKQKETEFHPHFKNEPELNKGLEEKFDMSSVIIKET